MGGEWPCESEGSCTGTQHNDTGQGSQLDLLILSTASTITIKSLYCLPNAWLSYTCYIIIGFHLLPCWIDAKSIGVVILRFLICLNSDQYIVYAWWTASYWWGTALTLPWKWWLDLCGWTLAKLDTEWRSGWASVFLNNREVKHRHFWEADVNLKSNFLYNNIMLSA